MTLTKHADEIAVKADLGLDEPTKVVESPPETICEEALAVCEANIKPILKSAPKITSDKTIVEPLPGKADKALHKLYDLEQNGDPEKPLNVNLDLYQMESY